MEPIPTNHQSKYQASVKEHFAILKALSIEGKWKLAFAFIVILELWTLPDRILGAMAHAAGFR
jgi:hypothetical protein